VITIADLRAHDDPILALTMGGIRNRDPRSSSRLDVRIARARLGHAVCTNALPTSEVRIVGCVGRGAPATWQRRRDRRRGIE
jgi:hypothetical protein